MSERNVRVVWRGGRSAVVLAVALLGGPAGPAAAVGPVDVPASSEPRVPVATCVEAAGFVASPGTGRPFVRVLAKSQLYSRDLLVVLPGLRAVLQPRADSVRLTLWGNLPQLSASPVLESAVILHDSRAFDLDFTLVRGRVVLTNAKKEGAARVWLRTDRGGVEVTLDEPGASVALETYGRWPAGVPFSLKPRPGVAPMWFWEVNVLKGQVELKTEGGAWSMSEPPGPATFHGDSVSGPDPQGPQRRERLPAWADPTAEAPAKAKRIAAVVAKYQGHLKAKDAVEAGQELLAAAAKDKDKARATMTRQLVIHALAALDQVDRVVDALDNPNHESMRKAAVIGLRHWIGAAPGRDEKVYKTLVDDFAYSKAEAEAVMQLLHSPFAASALL
jgi:hypothetical protein